jgi:group I intron endonuclease
VTIPVPKHQPVTGHVVPGDMAYLYKITNLENDKCYIGWTGRTVTYRWQRHQDDALKHRDNRKFYNAIRKHGLDCWQVETLLEVASVEEAKSKEIELIEKFDSYRQGYNATKGGDGNNGIVMSEESNMARSIAQKGIPKNYDRMKGKKHSEESKAKISMAHQGMKKPWVKPSREQIVKSALSRRSLSKDQYDQIYRLRSQGHSIRNIAIAVGTTNDLVKKWLHKEWSL